MEEGASKGVDPAEVLELSPVGDVLVGAHAICSVAQEVPFEEVGEVALMDDWRVCKADSFVDEADEELLFLIEDGEDGFLCPTVKSGSRGVSTDGCATFDLLVRVGMKVVQNVTVCPVCVGEGCGAKGAGSARSVGGGRRATACTSLACGRGARSARSTISRH